MIKSMEKDFIDLLELQHMLKRGVESLFPKRLWIKAEVSAVKARSGGHCYMELSQSSPEGLVAKANAIIWSSKYRFISPYFESVTGSPLQEGMLVLVEVQVNYSELYGMSLIISDIDPEFSLGVKELERQKTIERLRQEGLMELQKDLELPLLPYRLAVISAEDAAGYRDFIRHIGENPYGFKVETVLFPALMQGADCPSSIISALDRIMEEEQWDAVLILRGGGAKLDLACYDDYSLAAVIAQYPLPVLTAVGHDQDFHVCDMVAYEYLKTPTALADYILDIYECEDERISSCQTRIRLAASNRLYREESLLDSLAARIKGGFSLKLAAMESALQVLQTRIEAADPRRILDRGYALALDADGVVMKSVGGKEKGDKVSMMFADGILDCTVDSVSRHSEECKTRSLSS
ncbi:MAG: exodeoxyribonuclease VII large subunit [Bacteroidales bacterium]|nr:exodeoxyribonuclease VII large subunit [Bacteroidales bacterium]